MSSTCDGICSASLPLHFCFTFACATFIGVVLSIRCQRSEGVPGAEIHLRQYTIDDFPLRTLCERIESFKNECILPRIKKLDAQLVLS